MAKPATPKAKAKAKTEAKPRFGDGRQVWVTIEGKRVKSSARMARILKNVRGAFKGLSPD